MTKLKWPTKQGKSFTIPLFGGTMWVFFDREAYKTALKVVNYDCPLDLDAYGGVTTHLAHPEDGSIYVVGVFSNDLGIVCHECVDVAQSVMTYVGSKCDETQAYLVQSLFYNIQKHIQNHFSNS